MGILENEDINVKPQPININTNRIELIPRETIIKQAHTMVNGKNINIDIHYGNYITPPINGKYQTLPDEKYKNVLEEFLNSQEGIKYKHPTEQEIDRVSKETKKFIDQLKDANENIKPEQTIPKQDQQEKKQNINSKKPEGEQPQQDNRESTLNKPTIQAFDIKSTNKDVYLEAIKEESLKIQESELKEKAEQIKKDREQRQKIQKLEQELEAEKKKANKSVEKLTRKVLIQNEDKDITIDRALLKIVSICLILSTVMMGILIFLYNIR